MSTLTLPRFAVRYGDGPGYPMGGALDGAHLIAFTPLLPEGFLWRAADSADCIALDMQTTAELLFCSQIDAVTADVQVAIAAVHDQLCRCHCNRVELLERLGSDYGDWPVGAAAHMACCLILAARLLAVTP